MVLIPGSLLAMTSIGLDHISLLPVVIMGLPLESFPILASVYLAQQSILAVITKYLVQVSLLTANVIPI